MEITDLYNRIDELKIEFVAIQEKLKEAIVKEIYESANENPCQPKRISEHIIVIRVSDMVGNPWNPQFYDWQQSAKVVLEYLKNKPIENWKGILQEKFNKSKYGPVIFERIDCGFGCRTSYNIPINRLFIKKIIENI